MINVQHTLRIFGSALAMSSFKDKLLILDNAYNVYIYDRSSFELLHRLQITTKYEPRHRFEKSMTASNHFDLFVSIPRTPNAFLLNSEDKLKLTKHMNTHQSPHTTAKFSSDGSILAVGDESGRLLLYSMPAGKFITSLRRRPDYISAISFSSDNRYIAVSCFDTTTIIYDFETCRYVAHFASNGVVEQSAFAKDDKRVVCVTREHKICSWNIESQSMLVGSGEFLAWPTAIESIGERHLIVGTKDNNLYIVDVIGLKIVQTIEMDNHGISSFLKVANYLFIGYSDGEIKIINLLNGVKEFRIAMLLNKFSEATELILTKNIFLLGEALCSKYDEAWPHTLQSAKEMIIKGQRMQAVDAVRPFFIDKNKEEEFQFCVSNIKHLVIFQNMINQKDYIKAMRLADETPFLKKTDEYKILENVWHKLFQTAKELIEENNIMSLNKAKEMLGRYSSVKSKSALINNLLENMSVFVEANQYIKEKDFASYFLLVANNKFLEQEDIYRRVMMIGNQTYDKMKKYEHEGLIDDAIKVGEYLKVFLPLCKMLEQALILLRAKLDMTAKIQARDAHGVYWLVLEIPELEMFDSFINYHKNFLAVRKEALSFAIEGKPDDAKRALMRYVNIPYLASVVLNTMKRAYIAEIEIALSSDYREKVEWRHTYIRFIELFGVIEEIIQIYKTNGVETYMTETKINEDENEIRSVEFYDTILCSKDKAADE